MKNCRKKTTKKKSVITAREIDIDLSSDVVEWREQQSIVHVWYRNEKNPRQSKWQSTFSIYTQCSFYAWIDLRATPTKIVITFVCVCGTGIFYKLFIWKAFILHVCETNRKFVFVIVARSTVLLQPPTRMKGHIAVNQFQSHTSFIR